MTHFVYMSTQKSLVSKERDIYLKPKRWNGFYFSLESAFQESVSKQNFYACARKIDVAATFCLLFI